MDEWDDEKLREIRNGKEKSNKKIQDPCTALDPPGLRNARLPDRWTRKKVNFIPAASNSKEENF